MKVSELQARQGKVNIELEIISVETPREFNKFGNTGRVANAAAKDDSGEIKLTLWNDEIEKVNIGDKIKITNGYCSEFQGEKQLTSGKFGQIEKLEE